MQELVGVIPAAGRGVRAYPYTATIPKCMLEVDGVPLVRRNVELMRDQLGIRQIRVVTGHHGEVIRDYLGDGHALGVAIAYVENTRLDLELAYSVHLGTRGLETHCCVVLADECYVGTNHAELRAAADPEALATLTFVEADNPKAIRKNYTATIREDRILALEEKPATVRGALMGTGTYLLHPRLVARLAEAFAGDPATLPRDWTSWLGSVCREGGLVHAFRLRGRYVNVNSRDDLNHANYLVRDLGFERRTASLVYVVDEALRGGIGPARRFADEAALGEVVVACRAATPVPEDLATHPKVRVLPHPDPGAAPGALLRHGIAGARGDILVLAYSDDTVAPHDVAKLLVYLRDADMVVGTRTTRQMIEQGTNMRGLVRVTHILLAKLVELLWRRFECRFTDICCVYRAFWRSTWDTLSPHLAADGAEIFPELVLEALRARKRIIEIPVNYYNRDLEAPYVRSRYQSWATLRSVLALVLRKRAEDTRLRRWLVRRREARAAALPAPGGDAREHRRLEREWQNTVGHLLLETPHEAPGTAALFAQQFDGVAEWLRLAPPGPILEVGCGRGHFLRHLRAKPGLAGRVLIGLDLSQAVRALPGHGLPGVEGDGEALPVRSASLAALVYDGALHHLIDYRRALEEAVRVLAPGGVLVLYEPVSSPFSRLVHHVLDPFVFRKVVYESPIDRLYKDRFDETDVVALVREHLELRAHERSEFLAYPFTGCYAGSPFGRSVRFMRAAMAVERGLRRVPGVRRVGDALAWRFTVVAVKRQDAAAAGHPAPAAPQAPPQAARRAARP